MKEFDPEKIRAQIASGKIKIKPARSNHWLLGLPEADPVKIAKSKQQVEWLFRGVGVAAYKKERQRAAGKERGRELTKAAQQDRDTILYVQGYLQNASAKEFARELTPQQQILRSPQP